MFTITKQQSEAFIRNLKLSNGLVERMRARGINIQQPPVLELASALLLGNNQEGSVAKKSKGRGGKRC